MKPLTCEMCGSTNIIKEGDVFVCHSCGTKYSVEAAKKMLVEGTVKIDKSEELSNLLELAQRATESQDWSRAIYYYEKVLLLSPNNWEANNAVQFYNAFMDDSTDFFYSLCNRLNVYKRSFPRLNKLFKDNLQTDAEIAVPNTWNNVIQNCVTLYNQQIEYLASTVTFTTDPSKHNEIQAVQTTVAQNIQMILCVMWDLSCVVEETFGKSAASWYVHVWKSILNLCHKNKNINADFKTRVEANIQKYEPNYKAPKNNGCYVATAVYGSYDCPKVWTLRRFRDFTLAETWYGRAFICSYYAISPTLVKLFGEYECFKRMWQAPLDKLVSHLQDKGVENTPYNDKY